MILTSMVIQRDLKPWTIKGFSEDVSFLILSIDEFKPHHFLLHQVMNEVIPNFDMLSFQVLNMVLG